MTAQVQDEKILNTLTDVIHFHSSLDGGPMNYISASTHVENAENGDVCIYRHSTGDYAVSVSGSKGIGGNREASSTTVWFTEAQLAVLTSLLTGRKLNAGSRVSRPFPKR